MNEEKKLKIGTPKCGLVCALLGAVLALMLVFLGFWRTLFVAFFAAVGYFLGACDNKTDTIKGWINKRFPPKNE